MQISISRPQFKNLKLFKNIPKARKAIKSKSGTISYDLQYKV